ncbi:MAG: PqqD family protein [Bacilli bacterium]|nr:PqqD family protein [Bacilli bacterium]MDD7375461.1 PqqD family protein [Bacilli bacterium]MDD7549677.1 PqqD family protein [Bacilli bacterium]MDD7598334.1 PqqD family protein [Bacilli bacterium]MDY4156089.1 PqqD family protein [Bacilli bacterium]
MKIKNIYELKKVVNQYLVIRVEDALVLDNMITINEIGKDIFDFLKEEHSEDEVVSYILSNYEVTEEKAREDVHEFIEKLIQKGIVEC